MSQCPLKMMQKALAGGGCSPLRQNGSDRWMLFLFPVITLILMVGVMALALLAAQWLGA